MGWRRRMGWAGVAVGMLIGLGYSLSVVGSLGRSGEYLPPVDPDDEFAVEVRKAHEALNSAVGWEEWRPRYLRGTPARLRRLAVKYPNAASPLHDAAMHIERAIEEDERASAVIAHRAVAGLEALHRRQKGASARAGP